MQQGIVSLQNPEKARFGIMDISHPSGNPNVYAVGSTSYTNRPLRISFFLDGANLKGFRFYWTLIFFRCIILDIFKASS